MFERLLSALKICQSLLSIPEDHALKKESLFNLRILMDIASMAATEISVMGADLVSTIMQFKSSQGDESDDESGCVLCGFSKNDVCPWLKAEYTDEFLRPIPVEETKLQTKFDQANCEVQRLKKSFFTSDAVWLDLSPAQALFLGERIKSVGEFLLDLTTKDHTMPLILLNNRPEMYPFDVGKFLQDLDVYQVQLFFVENRYAPPPRCCI